MNKEQEERRKNETLVTAANAYAAFMDCVMPGWREKQGSKETPMRVAKSFMNDLCKSLHTDPPAIKVFENTEKYGGIITQCNIPVKSLCEHHHLPISGFAHVGYIGKEEKEIIGLSKLNRIVEYWSRQPQTQEHLSMQIHNHLAQLLPENKGIAVVIHASHFCTSHRGVMHDSEMHTAKMSGLFLTNEIGTRAEFYRMIDNALKLKR